MNPALVFSQLANSARTIVLASGTLSPIHSFQSELGTVFPHKLDANHVVPKENVYIRGVACGPTGVQLKANFANVNSWNFQVRIIYISILSSFIYFQNIYIFF